MIPRSVFSRLLNLGASNNTPVSSQLNIFLQKYCCWKEFKQFHISPMYYSTKVINEKKDVKRPSVGIWLNMTLKEVATVLKTNIETVQSLLPESQPLDHGPSSIIEQENILEVAKRLNKKCVLIKDPKRFKAVKRKVSAEYQPPPKPENLVKRPPVVTVMGHVDHGKTTLLDSLRNTSVVATEFGGITQHIGAFSVEVKPGERITFIDTPGHAAFTSMRARGAQVTDIVVLVIAADDGVMEQTVESIRIAKRAGVHVIVALNKIDKPSALSVDTIKERLLLEGIQVEDQGGDVQMVAISALKKINLDLLTEQILLEADIMNLRGDPTGLIEGVIIESKVDVHKGIVATVIVKRGTLKRGKILVAGKAFGRVRAMLDENGNQYSEALPSTPVQILGWKELPAAGDGVIEAKTEKIARAMAKKIEQEELMAKASAQQPIIEEKAAADKVILKKTSEYVRSLTYRERKRYFGELMKKKGEEKEEGEEEGGREVKIDLIIKGDVHGSVDALLDILGTYDKDEECQLSVIDASVGDISPKDVELADLFSAIVYGFNVGLHPNAKSLADEKNTDIRFFNVIYKLLDDLIAELNATLPPKDVEQIIGEARVNENFLISVKRKKIPVAGCTCVSGELKKGSKFKVIRGEEVIFEGNASSLKHHKTEVSTIQENVDCGVMLESFEGQFMEGDRIICYEMVKVPQTTGWKPGF